MTDFSGAVWRKSSRSNDQGLCLEVADEVVLLTTPDVLALRGLGFSLEQIRLMLDERLDADELRGMLRLRRAQLQQEVEESLEKLAQVEIRLSQIEQEGKMPEYEILTKQVEAITIVGARELVAAGDGVDFGDALESGEAFGDFVDATVGDV